MSNIRLRVAALIVQDHKVLLVEHQKDGQRYWLLPGGGVEYGETLAQSAKRELQEEANVTIETGDLAFVSETIAPDETRQVVHFVLLAKIIAGTVEIGREERLVQAKFVDIDELQNLAMRPPIGQVLVDYLKSPEPLAYPRYLGPLWCD